MWFRGLKKSGGWNVFYLKWGGVEVSDRLFDFWEIERRVPACDRHDQNSLSRVKGP